MARIAVVDDERDIREMLVGLPRPRRPQGGRRRATAPRSRRCSRAARCPTSSSSTSGFPAGRLRARARAACPLDPGIVILTGAGDLVDRVVGLEIGADDYLAKPVELPELAARIAAVLRRRPAGPAAVDGPAFGPYRLDLRAFCLRDATGQPVDLSPMEVDLVAAFATNPGRVLSRDELMRLAPPRDDESNDRSIDHRVTRLRRKLEADPEHPQLIKTVRGMGYVHAG